jgi:hypothetical protein
MPDPAKILVISGRGLSHAPPFGGWTGKAGPFTPPRVASRDWTPNG